MNTLVYVYDYDFSSHCVGARWLRKCFPQ